VTAPRFSDRAPSAFVRGPWAERLARLRAAGTPLLDLADHNPTAVGLTPLPGAAVLRALADPRALRYTPEPLGLPEARSAVARYYADRLLAMPAERVALTASTSEAYAHAFRLLCRPGEAFLVPAPSYPLFAPLAHAEGCRVEPWPLVLDPAAGGAGAWRVDKAGVLAAADAAPDARALVVVNPNHPTGSFLARDEAAWLRALCAERGLALVSDEVFGDFRGEFGRPESALARSLAGDDDGPLTLVFSGLSKVCGLPQLKLGWIAVGGPTDVASEALDRIEWFADAFLSVAQPVQHALPALLAGRGAFQDAVRARVARNRAALAATLAGVGAGASGAHLLPADGGWSAVAALPPVRSDEEWALALLDHDVVVHPGYFYDFAEPGQLVVSLLPEPAAFDRAMLALAAVARD
jgi:aspartate/methionine/tyrosine aminotransferase